MVFSVVVLTCSIDADLCGLILKLQLVKTNGPAKAKNRKKCFSWLEILRDEGSYSMGHVTHGISDLDQRGIR